MRGAPPGDVGIPQGGPWCGTSYVGPTQSLFIFIHFFLLLKKAGVESIGFEIAEMQFLKL